MRAAIKMGVRWEREREREREHHQWMEISPSRICGIADNAAAIRGCGLWQCVARVVCGPSNSLLAVSDVCNACLRYPGAVRKQWW